MDLWDAIVAGRGNIVSIIGAGGKTAALLALAQQARTRGLTTLLTTTTKIWLPDLPLIYCDRAAELDQALKSAFHQEPIVAAGLGYSEGKLLGLSPGTVCSLVSPELVLCEADGAAGKSLKIHRLGEPVVPACTTHLLVVAGLDAVGLPFAEAAHPAEFSAAYFGRPDDARVEEEHLAGALLEGAGFRPQSASLTFVLNKAEGQDRLEAARRIAREVMTEAPGARVLLVSRGQVIQALGGAGRSPSYTRP